MKSTGLDEYSGGAAGRVFIVDDDPDTRTVLRKLLEPNGYRIEEFGLAQEATRRIREDSPDLVLLDLHLPDGSGHDVLEAARADPETRLLPIVMLTGQGGKQDKIRATSEGVSDFLTKPFAAEELLPRVRSLILMKRFADEHEHMERVILMLATTIDARDPYTAGHSGRVAEYADRIAARMGLDPATRLEMRRGALFHDLGKIVIPDEILHKPGGLTLEDRKIVEQHPVVGYELLGPMRTMRATLPIVYSHHEKLDGSGYPDGLSGSAIPMTVRIVTIADVFDAMTTDRAYRGALNVDTAFEVLIEGVRKGWWDRNAAEELRRIVSESGVIGIDGAGLK